MTAAPAQLSLPGALPRIACIEVPALPLQRVLRAHPQWREDPLVIVESDRPAAPVLWANRSARKHRIERGLAFGQAKALAASLRAQVLDPAAVEQAVEELFNLLLRYSPYVEPSPHVAGLFFADPTGLGGLFGDYQAWAAQVAQTCHGLGYVAKVAVGFARPLLYALCCHRPSGLHVSECPDEEQAQALAVPLSQLHIPHQAMQDMALLGVRTVGALLALPAADLRVRYGSELADLHAFLAGRRWTPLQPHLPAEPLSLKRQLDPPDHDITRLLFGIKGLLQEAIAQLQPRSEAITACTVHLHLEYTVRSETAPAAQGPWTERVETAAPTLDPVQLAELLRLRLSGTVLPAPVCDIELTFEHLRVHPAQLRFQQERSQRNLAAANRALARVKAAFGDEAVACARLRPAHLPEARFAFEPCSAVRLPAPRPAPYPMPLVRRVFQRPQPLPPLPSRQPASQLGHHTAIERMFGPYRIAGGWWARARARDYYFAETKPGDLLWVFYDRTRRRWFLHGVVR